MFWGDFLRDYLRVYVGTCSSKLRTTAAATTLPILGFLVFFDERFYLFCVCFFISFLVAFFFFLRLYDVKYTWTSYSVWCMWICVALFHSLTLSLPSLLWSLFFSAVKVDFHLTFFILCIWLLCIFFLLCCFFCFFLVFFLNLLWKSFWDFFILF